MKLADEDYAESLRLMRKYNVWSRETIGQVLARVDRPRRDDLAKMLEAWKFWGELGPEFQSELLDCIEHTYQCRAPNEYASIQPRNNPLHDPADRKSEL